MLNKWERWAEEGAPSRIQGKGMNQIYQLLATRDFGRDVDLCTSHYFRPNFPERDSRLVNRELNKA